MLDQLVRFKWIALASALLLVTLLGGDQVRESVQAELRLALCLIGAALCAFALLAYVLTPTAPFGLSSTAWVRLTGSAVLVGFLLFILFVQGMECELRSTGRGISTVCKEVEGNDAAGL